MAAPTDVARPAASTTIGQDWPTQAADTIVSVVGQVRDKTTGPAVSATRAIVYGLLAAILGTTALVLLSILIVRLLVLGFDGILGVTDLERGGRAVWLAYLVLGAAVTGAGLLLWKKGTTTPVR